MDEQFDFKDNPIAEVAFLRLLLHQKGLPFESADRALDNYEIMRRLSDDHERPLLIDYGFENIAQDIFERKPVGEQWRAYEETLFNVKERAISRSRYHILAKAFEQRQTVTDHQDDDPYYT